jgi:hypothetical protein
MKPLNTVRMPDMLKKLFSVSLAKGMEIERGNWLTATQEDIHVNDPAWGRRGSKEGSV